MWVYKGTFELNKVCVDISKLKKNFVKKSKFIFHLVQTNEYLLVFKPVAAG